MSGQEEFLGYGTIFPTSVPPPSDSEASVPEDEDDEMFIQAFPGMAYTRSSDPHSIVIGERVRFKGTLELLARVEREARASGHEARIACLKALHGFYQDAYDLDGSNFERDLAWFRDAIKDAREAVHVILGYVPSSRYHAFEMNAAVEKSLDPVELLRLAATPGEDFLARRARFESRRQLVLAQLAFECRLEGMGPDDLQRRHDRLSSVLLERYFVPDGSCGVGLAVARDPENHYRVQRVRVCRREDVEKEGETYDVFPMRLLDVEGRRIPVLYRHRPKSNPILKLVAKRQRDPRTIQDGDGVKLVFLTMEDLRDGVEHLRRTVVRQPGSVFAQKSNLFKAGVVDGANRHSSQQFRADKFEVRFAGVPVEIQFLCFGDYLNEIGSVGAEHHDQYKARQYLRKVFPRFFPPPLYLSDDPGLMDSMLRAVAARIRLPCSLPAPAGFFLTWIFLGANMERPGSGRDIRANSRSWDDDSVPPWRIPCSGTGRPWPRGDRPSGVRLRDTGTMDPSVSIGSYGVVPVYIAAEPNHLPVPGRFCAGKSWIRRALGASPGIVLGVRLCTPPAMPGSGIPNLIRIQDFVFY